MPQPTRRQALQEFDPDKPSHKEEGFEMSNADRAAYNRWVKKRMAEHPQGTPNTLDEETWVRINRR